jgi:hypothetical protein
MSDQQELRQRREALAQAVNRHELEAVLSFIHPTFFSKTKHGFSVSYKEMVPMVEQLFAVGKDYQETVELEEIEVSGDSAKLVSRRTERARNYQPRQAGLFYFLGFMFLFLAIIAAGRAGEWDFQKIYGVGGYTVACVAFLGFNLFKRRSVQRTVRYQETWRTIDGQWLLVEEQEL